MAVITANTVYGFGTGVPFNLPGGCHTLVVMADVSGSFDASGGLLAPTLTQVGDATIDGDVTHGDAVMNGLNFDGVASGNWKGIPLSATIRFGSAGAEMLIPLPCAIDVRFIDNEVEFVHAGGHSLNVIAYTGTGPECNIRSVFDLRARPSYVTLLDGA
jgi:hypothetical protein